LDDSKMPLDIFIYNISQKIKSQTQLVLDDLGVAFGTEEFRSAEAGTLDARQGKTLDFWKIRNRGYELRIARGWGYKETERWIEENQALYEKAYFYAMSTKSQTASLTTLV